MAKNMRKILGWKPTPKGNINLGAGLLGVFNGPRNIADDRESPVTIAPETASANNAQLAKTIAQAQYFAMKNTLTA